MASTTPAADPVTLLQDLIRCASVTPTEAGVLDVLERALTPLGFTVTRLRFEGGGSYPVDNLFATRGTSGPHLLFAGHTDVVPPGDRALWTHDPFGAEIANGVLYGRGAVDMKSGVAAFVAACAAAPKTGRISIAITNDEEADSINGTARIMEWAAAQGYHFDFAIVGEPSATTKVGDSIKIGRRGSLNGRITVTGIQGHVAYPDKALNPLPVVANLIAALSGTLDDGNEHFPASNLEFTSVDVGNTVTNIIPATATLAFNVRFNDRWTPESLEEAICEGIESQDDEGTTIVLDVPPGYSRSFLSPLSDAVDTLVQVIEAQTGARPELSTGGGTSDARFIAPYCPVVECGLPGPTMHKVDECVPLADVHALTALYAAFLQKYSRMNPVADLTLAWRGLAMTVAGKREATASFNPTRSGLAIAILWFVVALLLSAAAQAMAVGMPSGEQLAIGFFIQAVTLAVLAVAIAQSLRFLKLEVPLSALLVPIIYFMGLIQVLAIPLNLLGPNIQLIAVFALALLIYRAARVLAGMRNGIAIAFALLCLMVLVVVPNALYIVFLQLPSPA